MSDFSSIIQQSKNLLSQKSTLDLSGVNEDLWSFIYFQFYKRNSFFNQSDIFIFNTEDEAEMAFETIKQYRSNIFYFPGFSENPFSSIIQSEAALFKRHLTLQSLLNTKEEYCLITTYSALHMKLPPKEHFKTTFDIEVSDIISPEDLAIKLSSIGFSSSPTVEEPGVYSKKGEIFDIYPLDHDPIRILYFDDMIEEIYKIDKETLKTLKDKPLEKISIAQSPQGVITNQSALNLRNSIPKYKIALKNKNTERNNIFEKLSNNMLFENYPFFYSLFFTEHTSLKDYISENSIFHYFKHEDSKTDFNNLLEHADETYQKHLDEDDDEIYPDPQKIYFKDNNLDNFKQINIDEVSVKVDLDDNLSDEFIFNLEPTRVYFRKHIQSEFKNKYDYIKSLIDLLNKKLGSTGKLYILYRNENSKEELEYIIHENITNDALKANIQYLNTNLKSGFYYHNENLFFLSESDLFSQKVKKTKKARSHNTEDMFADQLSTLKIGDYLIHKNHGVGKYLGMETISMSGQENDFIIIEYAENDKVYLPVYKLNLIQKHANQITEQKLDSLKTKKFEQTKVKARNSVKKLAFDILELNAKRKLKKGFAFSEPDQLFREFELDFPFEETPDQIHAINDVLDDMQKTTPMDRLVCGDVGFGKTEVAMRAAFKAVLDKKQVAILVPTTVLAFQHYNTFVKRFKEFPVNIEFISRFKTTKQVNSILERLEQGQVDILIGTHKLLSNSIKYKDLGLVIIDEEQRFGVAHKEKLKVLKETVDCMVMTATPIPRTLQLSFLGIKELSLIKTAPPKRQSIKTYIIKDDGKTVRSAIEKELMRGGQVFIVHNRVHDIDEYAASIKKLVPDAKIVIAHGQMPERELEKKIKEFYEHKHDILISTTIIESGIDIPSANTMIIDRADMYGLSQLHQLRGRIGRSDKKAYAYFLVPSNRNLSSIATKRLKALQTYADMGSGFSLATSDLEIRGSGDILGAEQSGHIANIGLELYMELLQEAIEEVKGQPLAKTKAVEIQTPFPSFIPSKFIQDTGLRLKFYKRLSNSKSVDDLENIVSEIEDQFGLSPIQANNLYIILKSRINIQHLALKSIKVLSKSIVLNFDEAELNEDENLRNKVVNFFIQRPKVYKLKPNFSVNCSFKDDVNAETLLDFTKYIAQQIDTC